MEHEQPDKSQSSEQTRKYVNSLAPNLVNDLGSLAHIRQALHRGTDGFGKRLTPEERRVLNTTLDALYKKIKEKWTEEGEPGPEGPDQHYRLYNPSVKAELIRRHLSGASKT